MNLSPFLKNAFHFAPDAQTIKVAVFIGRSRTFHGNLSSATDSVFFNKMHGDLFRVVGRRTVFLRSNLHFPFNMDVRCAEKRTFGLNRIRTRELTFQRPCRFFGKITSTAERSAVCCGREFGMRAPKNSGHRGHLSHRPKRAYGFLLIKAFTSPPISPDNGERQPDRAITWCEARNNGFCERKHLCRLVL